jgi:dCMP deaminase
VARSKDWDSRLLSLAKFVGEWSKDRSRKVGCVIADSQYSIRSIGYNGFPRGANDSVDSRHARPDKYLWTEHAERNAIYHAARIGIPLDGCTIYVPWFPCMDCARAIVQSGITTLVALKPDTKDAQWGEHFVAARALLKEAKVKVIFVSN